MEVPHRRNSPNSEKAIGQEVANRESDSISSSSVQSNLSSEEAQQLSDDLNALDMQEKDAERKEIYKHNKSLFLIQSTILGISYSIIWPTLWTYVGEEFNLSPLLHDFVYGITYVAYPLGSMLSAKMVEKTSISTKNMILVLNTFEIIGSIVYTLAYNPSLPVIGRFIAGLGDAFYVVLMKETQFQAGVPDDKMTIDCLAAFIVGIVLAPGINILTTLMHFQLGSWNMNANTFPGLTTAVLFVLMQFLLLFFLQEIPDREPTNSDGNDTQSPPTTRFIEVTNMLKDIPYTTWYVNFYAFVYTYIVAMFELFIPIFMYKTLAQHKLDVMLLYAIIGTIYAMFLMMTMSVTFDYQPETFVCLSVVMEIVGLFAVIYFTWLHPYTVVADVVSIACMVVALTALWSSDDVLFINFVQMFIPFEQREVTHSARKLMSKMSFTIAGLTVPFLNKSVILFVGPALVFIVCAMFVLFIVIRCTAFKKDI